MKVNGYYLFAVVLLGVCCIGYHLYPEHGSCTFVGIEEISCHNPCKQFLVENNMCKLFRLEINGIGCDNIGKNVDDCIRINGVNSVDGCMLSYTSADKLYWKCRNDKSFREYVSNNSNYTDIKYKYVYNFKNNKYDTNITNNRLNYIENDYIKTGLTFDNCSYYPFFNRINANGGSPFAEFVFHSLLIIIVSGFICVFLLSTAFD